jgi:hypothetical protein
MPLSLARLSFLRLAVLRLENKVLGKLMVAASLI